jgi:hypothetical protein
VLSALERLRQEDQELEASSGYITSPCLKTNQKRRRRRKGGDHVS